MATIRRRGNTWQVQVRRQGFPPLSRTFKRKADADQWARHKEAEIDRGELPADHRALRLLTLGALLERYGAMVTPKKRGADQEHYKLRVLLGHPIARLSLDRITAAEIANYRDARLSSVKGDTVRRELAVLRHCLELARDEWGIGLASNSASRVKLPAVGQGRQRRASEEELQQLLNACRSDKSTWLPAMIILAVETGMRRGELLAMRWVDVDFRARTVHLQITKNGQPRTVPLSPRAHEVLRRLPQGAGTIFPVSANAFRLAWERLRRRVGVIGLRFHDLRHEAVSRFFEKGLSMAEVAAISGHREDAHALHPSQSRCDCREAVMRVLHGVKAP
jgi:integrase